jgi:hypothetical protein
MLVSCVAYSSILKMEGICSSEKSADYQRTMRLYSPEDIILQLSSIWIHILARFTMKSVMLRRASGQFTLLAASKIQCSSFRLFTLRLYTMFQILSYSASECIN